MGHRTRDYNGPAQIAAVARLRAVELLEPVPPGAAWQGLERNDDCESTLDPAQFSRIGFFVIKYSRIRQN